MSPDTLSVVLRASSFVALLQAAGTAIFLALSGPYVSHSHAAIRRFGIWSAVVALPLLVAQYLLEPARMAGDFSGILDPALQRTAFRSSTAVTFGARLAGAVLLLAGLSRVRAVGAGLGVGGALFAAASFALVGHTAVHPWRLLLAPALMSHVFIAALWFGSIPALYLVTLREAPDLAARSVEAFSRIAIWVVPGLAIAGTVMAVVLVRHLTTFHEPYGRLLLAKIAGFALLMGVAAVNRLRLGPAVARGATQPFKRSLAVEYLLIAGILAVTATMTSLYSPEP